ncbi:MAG TPA: alpha/beta hydrolase family protein [Acidimicrobiales bacterium]|nr:alpha/beta hydrolase family protein [Acidimicrobiales bacterium]
MRTLIGRVVVVALGTALLSGVAPGAAQLAGGNGAPAPGCPVGPQSSMAPSFVTDVVPLPTGVHVVSNKVNVILPAGYCTSGQRYPVLYLLHGAGDTYGAWESNTDIKQYLTSNPSAYPFIVVMPDDGANAEAGWYTNWYDGEWQYETYDIAVLQSFVNTTYATLPDHIGVAGLSMGGFGALSYAARHPHMFKVAASFSGAVDTLYGAPVSGVAFTELHSMYGTPDDAVWGNQVTNRANWAAHDPATLAPDLAGTTILLASGTGTPGGAQGDALDPTGDFNPGGYFLENAIFQMNLSLVRSLTLAHVPYISNFYPGGYHGWPYWQADLHWALPYIKAALGSPHS